MFNRLALFLTLMTAFLQTSAQIRLPRLISDGMILQRDKPARLWGYASPGEKVSLVFKKTTYTAITGKDGKWMLTLPAQPAGGPFELSFSATNRVVVKDVLFGDVWICAGQSNMELPLHRVQDFYGSLIAQLANPAIRQFEVPDRYNFKKPEEDLTGGSWQKAQGPSLNAFTAVGFFFAADLYKRYRVPIGLINTALGGSPAEAWISETQLIAFPKQYEELQRFKNDSLIDAIEAANTANQRQWSALLYASDPGITGQWQNDRSTTPWADSIKVPGYFPWKGNGSTWFRKQLYLSAAQASKPARLILGRIVDADSVFVNGRFAGTTSYQYPPRRYELPQGLLKEGWNTITVRIINSGAKGGWIPDKPYALVLDDDSLQLLGYWQYRRGAAMQPITPQVFVRWKPGGLYNGMIAPLEQYAAKGVIWYQGEANTARPAEYRELMKTLIAEWRRRRNEPAMPFLFVQLANYMEAKPAPSESNWAATRQSQLETLEVPNTGMAVAIDVGEWNDIHPLRKREVGERLALEARRIAYGEKKLLSSGPLPLSVTRKENHVWVNFDRAGKGLRTTDGKIVGYVTIAGADGRFVVAETRIRGKQLEVWHPAISLPVTVRYAWADNPVSANLVNDQGLPASPFTISVKE